MPRIVYVNGDYLPEDAAKISVFDRAFLFGDAVYEVTAVLGGRLVDFDAHLARLDRSLGEIDLPLPIPHEGLRALHEELITENKIDEGIVYLQISRGRQAERGLSPGENRSQRGRRFGAPRIESGAALRSGDGNIKCFQRAPRPL